MLGAAAVCGALLLGSIVGAFPARLDTDQAGARLAARRVLIVSFCGCVLVVSYVLARALDDL